jgi:hypothetical protein
MIELNIPIGKAIVAVEISRRACKDGKTKCFFKGTNRCLACRAYERKDGKNVIYQLVDYHPDPLERLAAVINELKSNDPPLIKEEADALLSRLLDKGAKWKTKRV